MSKGRALVALVVVALWVAAPLQAAKLGKLFIKSAPEEVGGQQFTSTELEDSVKDLQKRIGDFILAKDEAEADFLMVVIKRQTEVRDDDRSAKVVYATLSVKEAGQWKAGAQLRNAGFFTEGSWGNAARGVMGAAEKWVKAKIGK